MVSLVSTEDAEGPPLWNRVTGAWTGLHRVEAVRPQENCPVGVSVSQPPERWWQGSCLHRWS